MRNASRRRRFLSSPAAALLMVVTTVALAQPATAGQYDPVPDLRSKAEPLRSTAPSGSLGDLRPLGQAIGDATVVGLGEATHGTHEFFTLKHRVFRYLVEQKGFTTFALEASWSAGLRLNAYVLHGKGDPEKIIKEEFENPGMWSVREYVELAEWMRRYNTRHAKKVQFIGDDANYPEVGGQLIKQVTEYVRHHQPRLLPEVDARYRKLRQVKDADAFLALPLTEREALAAQARQVVDLMQGHPAKDQDRRARAVQDARSIAQSATALSFDTSDPQQVGEALLYRDKIMADNVAWWQGHTGAKILLSAHNVHVAYESYDAKLYPKVQGAFLRDRFGARYVNVGLTFGQGAFRAQDEKGQWRTVKVSPAAEGSNNQVLEGVSSSDYFLDMRTVSAPARAWLDTPRSTRDLGRVWPEHERMVSLGKSYDALIYLHTTTAAHPLS
ncbi:MULTISPECIES: erythromycin esterase family protein [unclassified Streptosporangium]|uniref:erythromycin esterase family protein n=1 Tax=unclassified Streptosporangium TaxID=2632669 RepID=UPI002E2D38FD|nr:MULTISPECIES: erythromycin esterase family protein [unclassified Streptosporangium]